MKSRRTTVTLSRAVLLAARREATSQRRSLSALIEERLRQHLARTATPAP